MNGDGMFFPWDGSNHPQGATVSWKFIIPVGDVGPRSIDEIILMVQGGPLPVISGVITPISMVITPVTHL